MASITTKLYGFEDYNVVVINGNCFLDGYGYTLPCGFCSTNKTLVPNKNLPIRFYEQDSLSYYGCSSVHTDTPIYKSHPELLNNAKKLFVHPSCKLPRTMLAEKYKKVLNPWAADVIVVPELDTSRITINMTAFFINDADKIIVLVYLDADSINKIQGMSEGDRFCDWVPSPPLNDDFTYLPYNKDSIDNSKCLYVGKTLFIPNDRKYIIDFLMHTLPADKCVYERDVQESLSNKSNQLTLDSLIAIKEMLESSDEDTISAGLKSLSMMDYAHYTNSLKYFFREVIYYYKYRYNKAMSATSVKFMFKYIFGQNYYKGLGRSCGYDTDIYAADYKLMSELKRHFDNISDDDDLNREMKNFPFMTVVDGVLSPNLKDPTDYTQDECN